MYFRAWLPLSIEWIFGGFLVDFDRAESVHESEDGLLCARFKFSALLGSAFLEWRALSGGVARISMRSFRSTLSPLNGVGVFWQAESVRESGLVQTNYKLTTGPN